MSEIRKVVFDEEIIDNTEKIEKEATWEEYNLKSSLVKGIYSIGFERPSYIQKKAIPIIVKQQNIRAQAQSGTGKTGAFCARRPLPGGQGPAPPPALHSPHRSFQTEARGRSRSPGSW